MADHDPTTPTPSENVGPNRCPYIGASAQIDDLDATPGHWDGPWDEGRSVEITLHGEDPNLPLGWCDGAGAVAEEVEDMVQAVIVLPEGMFVMELRRIGDGRLILSVPHPGAGGLPAPIYQLAPGTYQVRDAVRTEDLT